MCTFKHSNVDSNSRWGKIQDNVMHPGWFEHLCVLVIMQAHHKWRSWRCIWKDKDIYGLVIIVCRSSTKISQLINNFVYKSLNKVISCATRQTAYSLAGWLKLFKCSELPFISCFWTILNRCCIMLLVLFSCASSRLSRYGNVSLSVVPFVQTEISEHFCTNIHGTQRMSPLKNGWLFLKSHSKHLTTQVSIHPFKHTSVCKGSPFHQEQPFILTVMGLKGKTEGEPKCRSEQKAG